MGVILILAAFHMQESLRPLDSYKLNYTEISLSTTYKVMKGHFEYAKVADKSIWNGDSLSISSASNSDLLGEWSMDGATEKYKFKIRGQISSFGHAKTATKAPKNQLIEMLYDGKKFAQTTTGGKHIMASTGSLPMYINQAHGPFQCWGFPFLTAINEFGTTTPIVTNSQINDCETICEVYRKEHNGFYQLEVHYEPAINFLPKYMRRVRYLESENIAYVQERLIVKSARLANGAFVPTKVVEVTFNDKEFATRYPNFTHKTALNMQGKVNAQIFEITKLDESSQPVAIARQPKSVLITPGQLFSLKHFAKDVTLPSIAAKAGSELYIATRKLPELDKAEANAYPAKVESQRDYGRMIMIAVASVLGVVCVGYHVWKQKRVIGVWLIVSASALFVGCRQNEAPVVKLSAQFATREYVYEYKGDVGPPTVILKNSGNLPITIKKLDGGCTCRWIDQSCFPLNLLPAHSMPISVRFQMDSTSYSERIYSMIADTDKGLLSVHVPLTALPRHQLEPNSIENGGLSESGDWSFSITHRYIYDKTNNLQKAVLAPIPGFDIVKVSSKSGLVRAMPRFAFEDTEYRIVLKDKACGTYKRSLDLVEGSKRIVQCPILWTRHPFLACLPSRVLLSRSPIRVFLRCPDDSVELTSVLASPDGVKAVISSPREVMLQRTFEAESAVNGTVDIATSDERHPKLSIPVRSLQ